MTFAAPGTVALAHAALTPCHRGCRFVTRLRGAGPPVLFIQGTGVHGDGWTPQTDVLHRDFACVSFDNRGMGGSQPRGCAITVPQMAEDALAVMDAYQWSDAHVVGHSLGGLIAVHLALTARVRVRSLSLLCTFANGRDATKLTASMLWIGLRTRVGSRRQRRRAFLQLVMTPDAWAAADLDAEAERLAGVFGHDLADAPSVQMAQMRAMSAYDATPRLRELAGLPTLVVSGDHDRIARPPLGEALARAIPGARFHLLADAAHGVPIHRAADINNLLREHISDAERQRN
jgi:pimeloyl-ACP methyl ester carboxylesterase